MNEIIFCLLLVIVAIIVCLIFIVCMPTVITDANFYINDCVGAHDGISNELANAFKPLVFERYTKKPDLIRYIYNIEPSEVRRVMLIQVPKAVSVYVNESMLDKVIHTVKDCKTYMACIPEHGGTFDLKITSFGSQTPMIYVTIGKCQ